MDGFFRIEFASRTYSKSWLFGAKTNLVDSGRPHVEEIRLPEAVTTPGFVEFHTNSRSLASKFSLNFAALRDYIRERLPLGSSSLAVPSGFVAVDFRFNSPQNWAHAFTNHLPLALLFREKLKEKDASLSPLYVFPNPMPKKIIELFELSDLHVVKHRGPIVGDVFTVKIDKMTAIRGSRVEMCSRLLRGTALSKMDLGSQSLAKKIFISRRESRAIVNEREVEDFLYEQGYKKIYLEDYSLTEQIATLAFSTDIVAIHGAALGPLILRGIFNKKPYNLIEIFSPAHVTNVFRVIAFQTGGRWGGVRGGIVKRFVPRSNALTFDTRKLKYDTGSFYACLSALSMALDRQRFDHN